MKVLIKSRLRLGDALLCLPSALFLHQKGHEVWIECPAQWHSIFQCVSYARPCAAPIPSPDLVLDTNFLDMTRCQDSIIDYVSAAFPQTRDVPRGSTVLFDRDMGAPKYNVPDRYVLVSPFGYSQFRKPSPEWLFEKARQLVGSRDPIVCLSDRPQPALGVPMLIASDVSHLPTLIARATEVFTTNSAPNIIAAAVRRSHFHVLDDDPIGGRTNYIVSHQISIHQDDPAAEAPDAEFSSWYVPRGQGSGPGSAASYNVGFIKLVEGLLEKLACRSVLDYGCGDWQYASRTAWGDRLYYGVDVVPELIGRLRQAYGSPNRIFYRVDQNRPLLPNKVDLVVCKDVLQHIPNADVHRLVGRFLEISDAVLLINDIHPDPAKNNADVRRGGYRCLDLSKPPFGLAGQEVYRFPPQPHTPELPKIAYLIDRRKR